MWSGESVGRQEYSGLRAEVEEMRRFEEDEAKEYGARRRAVRRGTELQRSRNVIISVVNLTYSIEWSPTTTTSTMI